MVRKVNSPKSTTKPRLPNFIAAKCLFASGRNSAPALTTGAQKFSAIVHTDISLSISIRQAWREGSRSARRYSDLCRFQYRRTNYSKGKSMKKQEGPDDTNRRANAKASADRCDYNPQKASRRRLNIRTLAALKYARAGFGVLQVHGMVEHPHTKNRFHDATRCRCLQKCWYRSYTNSRLVEKIRKNGRDRTSEFPLAGFLV